MLGWAEMSLWRMSRANCDSTADVRNAGYMANWIELLKADKRAFFTACSKDYKAADYLRGLALAEPADRAA